MTTKLIPLQYDFTGKTGKRFVGYEQVMLQQDGSPATMFHVDLLWNTPEHKAIHERLCAGETVEVEMTIRAVEA